MLLIVGIFFGALLRMVMARSMWNYDMGSWRIVAGIALNHKNIYAWTDRYNYGPVWMIILYILGSLHDALGLTRLGVDSFHLVVAAFLTLVDIVVAILLLFRGGIGPALFFILNPLLILLTGIHSQIDTLAILPALGAWMLLEKSPAITPRRLVAAACLMALSLITKHLMLFFPIWLLFCPTLLPSLKMRLSFLAISIGLFLASFIPFLFTPGAAHGILVNVIAYRGVSSTDTLLSAALGLFVPLAKFGAITPQALPKILEILFIALTCLLGWIIARRKPGELLEQYLLVLLICASSMSEQYLAIPLIACAMAWRHPATWMYLLASCLVLLSSDMNLGLIMKINSGFTYINAQIWLIFLLLDGLIYIKPADRCDRF